MAWCWKDEKPLSEPMMVRFLTHTVFKIRSETCRTEAQFCQNLYIFIYDKEGKLAGPTQILPVNVRGPALILKTAHICITRPQWVNVYLPAFDVSICSQITGYLPTRLRKHAWNSPKTKQRCYTLSNQCKDTKTLEISYSNNIRYLNQSKSTRLDENYIITIHSQWCK